MSIPWKQTAPRLAAKRELRDQVAELDDRTPVVNADWRDDAPMAWSCSCGLVVTGDGDCPSCGAAPPIVESDHADWRGTRG